MTTIPKSDKKLKSPFEVKEHALATRPDDKRLLPEQADRLIGFREATQFQPGTSGNAGKTRVLAMEKLEAKLQEHCKLKKMSYEDAINDVLVKGAIGQVRLSPTQISAMSLILQYRLGKPRMHEAETSGRPILIMNGPTQVNIHGEE